MSKRFSQATSGSNNVKDPPGIYQFARIGRSLKESTEELLLENKISPFLAGHILKVFDRKMSDSARFRDQPEMEFETKSMQSHKLLDSFWQIQMKGVVFNRNSMDDVFKFKNLTILADTWGDVGVEKRKGLNTLIAKP